MTQPEQPKGSVASKLASGAVLNFMGMLGVRLLGMINIVILARLLTPDDFGVMALALIAVGFTEALINKQFESALIRQPDPTPAHFDTAFSLAALVGLGGAIAVFSLSGVLARFFDTPELKPVLLWLSVVPLIMGLRNPYFIGYEKALNFVPRLRVNLWSRLIMTITSVVAGIILQSYWALVIALIVLHSTWTIFTWVHDQGRPRFGLSYWKSFAQFGGWLTLAGLAVFAQRRFPSAILGRMGGTFEAGLFQIGNEIATTMTQQMISPIGEALYPSLMSVSDSAARLRQAYLSGQQGLLGIALPLGAGIAVASPEVVRVLLGLQWEPAVPIIATLTPVTALLTLSMGVNAVKMIDGDTRSLCMRNLFVLGIVIPLTIGGYLAFGVTGLVVGQAIALLVNLLLTLQIAAKATQTRLIDPLIAAKRTIIAVICMVVILIILDLLLGMNPFEMSLLSALMILLLKVIVGGVVLFAVQGALWHMRGRPEGFERQIINFAFKILRRNK